MDCKETHGEEFSFPPLSRAEIPSGCEGSRPAFWMQTPLYEQPFSLVRDYPKDSWEKYPRPQCGLRTEDPATLAGDCQHL